MTTKRANQVIVRLSDQARAALDELCERWHCSDGVLIQSVIVQLQRRTDLTSILDVGAKALGSVDVLKRCHTELGKAIKSVEAP